jgi:cyclopropane-fatty-acyl-phospholipid synthase
LRLANWNVFGAACERRHRLCRVVHRRRLVDQRCRAALSFFIANRDTAENHLRILSRRLVYRLRHLLNRNTKAQARRNIHAHYDLGNDFYALWLDPTMSYSSAMFARRADPHAPADDVEMVAAQHAKYRRVLDELELPAGASVLELGCGWGGFAAIAGHAGHRSPA